MPSVFVNFCAGDPHPNEGASLAKVDSGDQRHTTPSHCDYEAIVRLPQSPIAAEGSSTREIPQADHIPTLGRTYRQINTICDTHLQNILDSFHMEFNSLQFVCLRSQQAVN